MTNAEKSKKWREANPEKWRKTLRASYQKHKIKRAAYRKKNKNKRGDYERKRRKSLDAEQLAILKHRQRESVAKLRCRRRKIMDSLKLEIGCQNPACQWSGSFESCDLDFHHIDPSSKFKSVTLLLGSCCEKIAKEVQKCTILCAICHRRATHSSLDCSTFKLCDMSLAQLENM